MVGWREREGEGGVLVVPPLPIGRQVEMTGGLGKTVGLVLVS